MRTPTVLAALLLAGTVAPAEAQTENAGVVRAIEIRRVGVFDSTEASNWIFRLANRLHSETRESVIRPELLFRKGRPFDSAATAESMRNLRALGIFREVETSTVQTDSGLVQRLVTRDAWSTTVGFDLSSTGNTVSYSTQFMENNLFGTGSRLLVRYGRQPEHDEFGVEFSRPRMFLGKVGLDVFHQVRSDGHESFAILDNPFRSVASPYGSSLTFREFDGRVMQFFNGESSARDTLENRMQLLTLTSARALHASERGYLRVGLVAQLLRNDYDDWSSTLAFPHHTVFTAGPTLSLSRARFATTTNYQRLEQVEDLDLSTTLSLGALIATTAGGSPRNGIGPFGSLRIGREIPGGFGVITGQASGLFSRSGLDSGTAVFTGTGIFRLGGSRQRLLLRAEGGMAHNMAPIDQFDLGLGFGPRGFGAHAFTGDRYQFATAEYRYTVAPELGHVAGVAVAAFADYGGAWYHGWDRRTGADAGVGVRLGVTRVADLRAISIDLVRRFGNDARDGGWVVVIGKGFNFTTTR